jgi:transposase InsO family protein
MSGVKRGKTGVPTKVFSPFAKIKGYRRFLMISYSLYQYDTTKVAQYRLEAIKFFEEFGLKATKKAFKISKTTFYRWRKALKDNQGRLSSLIPCSTRPKRVRRMTTDARIVGFIKDLREKHPRLGKEKIKPLLDEYCQERGISSLSESTIGKVIKRNNLFYQKLGRVYHDPGSGWAQRKKTKRLRVKYSPQHQEPGHLEADSVTLFVDGLKRYIFSAIDVKLKFSFSACYSSLNSRNGKDFISKLEEVSPLKIKSIQTDNGLEFLGELDDYLRQKNIPHFFSYPRCPRINGVVERYQRTLQEEFVNHHLDLISNPRLFNQEMVEYLVWYNTKRPHKSLGLKSPMDYLVSRGHLSQMSVTYTKC